MNAVPKSTPAPVAEIPPEIDYDSLVTEDHKPVERIFVEKLYRLLTTPLLENWRGPGEGRPFVVLANVGWFYQHKTPAVAPDCLLSLDVNLPGNLRVKQGHSYYQWDAGKPPDVIIEIVSDRSGGEESYKKDLYARQGVAHYVVFDPDCYLGEEPLRVYQLVAGRYVLGDNGPWPGVGLGVRLWEGEFEGAQQTWLRWCDDQGQLIPTPGESSRQFALQAEQTSEKLDETAEELEQTVEELSQARDRIRALEEELRRLRNQPPA